MSTEYCNVCGCVVPYCKHTEVKAAGPWLRVCHTPFTQIIDNLRFGSVEEAIEHCKATLKLNPEYPRIVLHAGTTSDTPIVWDSKVEADLQQEMAEAAMMMCGIDPEPKLPRTRKKAEYKMINPEIIPATTLMDIPEHVGKFVAMGFMLHADGERHEFKTRTSLLVKVDIEAGYIETLNSIYRIV